MSLGKNWRVVSMSTDTTSTTDLSISTKGIALTDVAAEKVSALLVQEGRDDLSLRVAVQPGGCSGLRYQLYFDDRQLDGFTIDNPNAQGSCACGDSFN
jgi:Fe-S cluster assembly iron-binding protein IscA